MQFSRERLIRLPLEHSKANYVAGFWRWVELLAADDYQGAFDALYWSKPVDWTPDELKERVTTFYGGTAPWSVVIPNGRLVQLINETVEFQVPTKEGHGWFMAQIPLTTEPAEPKSDKIPLMGLASSFFVRENAGVLVLEHEIFHL